MVVGRDGHSYFFHCIALRKTYISYISNYTVVSLYTFIYIYRMNILHISIDHHHQNGGVFVVVFSTQNKTTHILCKCFKTPTCDVSAGSVSTVEIST